jgi:hypothetical protein
MCLYKVIATRQIQVRSEGDQAIGEYPSRHTSQGLAHTSHTAISLGEGLPLFSGGRQLETAYQSFGKAIEGADQVALALVDRSSYLDVLRTVTQAPSGALPLLKESNRHEEAKGEQALKALDKATEDMKLEVGVAHHQIKERTAAFKMAVDGHVTIHHRETDVRLEETRTREEEATKRDQIKAERAKEKDQYIDEEFTRAQQLHEAQKRAFDELIRQLNRAKIEAEVIYPSGPRREGDNIISGTPGSYTITDTSRDTGEQISDVIRSISGLGNIIRLFR